MHFSVFNGSHQLPRARASGRPAPLMTMPQATITSSGIRVPSLIADSGNCQRLTADYQRFMKRREALIQLVLLNIPVINRIISGSGGYESYHPWQCSQPVMIRRSMYNTVKRNMSKILKQYDDDDISWFLLNSRQYCVPLQCKGPVFLEWIVPRSFHRAFNWWWAGTPAILCNISSVHCMEFKAKLWAELYMP